MNVVYTSLMNAVDDATGTFFPDQRGKGSDGSDPRIGPGSARDRPFLKGLGSNFREGPKLGIGSGSMPRIEGPEGPEDLL